MLNRFFRIILILIIFCFIVQCIQLRFPNNKRIKTLDNTPKLLSDKYFNPTKISLNQGNNSIYFFRDYDPLKDYFISNSSQVIVKNGLYSEDTILFNKNMKKGYEDPRSILYNGNIYLFVAAINDETKLVEMYITKYKPGEKLDAIKIKYPFETKVHNKNFMPFISNNKLYFIFSTTPQYIILELEKKNNEITGNTKEIIRRDAMTFNIKGKESLALTKDCLRGSTKGCLYKNYLYFGIHKAFILYPMKYYANHILVIEKNYPFNIIAISQPFVLTDTEIILTDLHNPLLMFLNFGVNNINFLTDMEISEDGVLELFYGYDDKESYSVKCNLTDIIDISDP
jgi:hypothetical protein